MSKTFVIVVAIVVLSACTNAGGPRLVVKPSDIPPPPRLHLPPPPPVVPFEVDVPRDMSNPRVRDEPGCRDVPENRRDAAWKKRCIYYPPLSDSNIVFGFRADDWTAFTRTLAELRAWIRAVLEAIRAHEKALDRYERDVLGIDRGGS